LETGIGSCPIGDVEAVEWLDILKKIETLSANVDEDRVADFVLQINGRQDTSHGWVL